MFQTILFAIDITREARSAAEVVADLVKIHNSKLVILSVVETSAEGVMSSTEQVAKLLTSAKSFLSDRGINAETIEKEGMPPFVICDVADEINADLIVMGCRGLGLVEDSASDSVTIRVINLAPCPVLVVP
ncbi:universal stress protein [Myxosarcina sp. GI1]|uniref:universal stress protein n=1 Tax=Myxosarcina sp. GI1 TaxID=1541065 RepID=UPI00055CE91B|nr:universal stress protein [Myxosarcina sp. GI1]